MFTLSWCFVFLASAVSLTLTDKITDENAAKSFARDYNIKLGNALNRQVLVDWEYQTDINNRTIAKLVEETVAFNKYVKEQAQKAKQFDTTNFADNDLKRQIVKLSWLGTAALNDEDGRAFTQTTADMQAIYSSAKVCVKGKCNLELEPDLTDMLSKSRDYEQLKEAWLSFRDATGKKSRQLYKRYVALGNKAAEGNGLKTLDDVWFFPWETSDFKVQVEKVWQQVEPFYQKLHAYVRMKLRKQYPDHMPADGTIPANIVGNMWSQSWGNIYSLVVPFHDKPVVDVSRTMNDQGYSPLKMFQLADQFFGNLGLIKMPQTFWQYSVINRIKNREMVCHASAWDFYNAADFRIKMCTAITMNELVTVHHEMGHIEYFLQYKEQPMVYREGANPGFHEAIGDLLALSVSTPAHLHKLGLLNALQNDEQGTINFQMQIALQKLVFLPFGYLMDLWRWDVFSGKVDESHWNRHWWELKLKYQGISPPGKRSEQDFDPGAKYHIVAGVEYIRYFASHILQFSFHKALCEIAQPNVPLHQCDIDGNKNAGKHLSDVLKLGSSKPWQEQLKQFTGSAEMNAKALLEYFDPLIKYLDKELVNETVGWKVNVDNYFT